jgi:hypothetical protein
LVVDVLAVDTDPPTPDPAEHASNPSSLSNGSIYYQFVYAVEADDPSGVEYKFVCSDSTFSSGGDRDAGPEWRNEDNVGEGTANPTYPGGMTYNGDTLQVPYVFVVPTTSSRPDLIWWIYYRDRSPNRNAGGSSEGWSYAAGLAGTQPAAQPLPDLPPYEP